MQEKSDVAHEWYWEDSRVFQEDSRSSDVSVGKDLGLDQHLSVDSSDEKDLGLDLNRSECLSCLLLMDRKTRRKFG